MDGMENMGWQSEFVMWMGNRDEAKEVEEGSVLVGMGEDRDGYCQYEHRRDNNNKRGLE